MEWLLGPLMLSFLGSLHCAGMCGGFALLAYSGPEGKKMPSTLVAYLLGKTTTYVVAGIGFGSIGIVLHKTPVGSKVLLIAVGLTMILVGLEMAGVNFKWRVFSSGSPGWISKLIQQSMGAVKTGNRFVLGLLNGILPCGLLYAAFAGAAATSSPLAGGLYMLIFGLGTIPALILSAHLFSSISAAKRLRMAKLTGWIIAGYGLFMLIRALGLVGSNMTMH